MAVDIATYQSMHRYTLIRFKDMMSNIAIWQYIAIHSKAICNTVLTHIVASLIQPTTEVMFLAVSRSGGVTWRLVNSIEDYIIASVRHIIWWFGWSDRFCCIDWNLFDTGSSQVCIQSPYTSIPVSINCKTIIFLVLSYAS